MKNENEATRIVRIVPVYGCSGWFGVKNTKRGGAKRAQGIYTIYDKFTVID